VASALSQFDVKFIVDLIRAVAVFIVAVNRGLAALIRGRGSYRRRAGRAARAGTLSAGDPRLSAHGVLDHFVARHPSRHARSAESDLRISRTVASFVLPVGASVGPRGERAVPAVAVMFVARLYGVPSASPALFQAGAAVFLARSRSASVPREHRSLVPAFTPRGSH